jgi:hypothetical protein
MIIKKIAALPIRDRVFDIGRLSDEDAWRFLNRTESDDPSFLESLPSSDAQGLLEKAIAFIEQRIAVVDAKTQPVRDIATTTVGFLSAGAIAATVPPLSFLEGAKPYFGEGAAFIGRAIGTPLSGVFVGAASIGSPALSFVVGNIAGPIGAIIRSFDIFGAVPAGFKAVFNSQAGAETLAASVDMDTPVR